MTTAEVKITNDGDAPIIPAPQSSTPTPEQRPTSEAAAEGKTMSYGAGVVGWVFFSLAFVWGCAMTYIYFFRNQNMRLDSSKIYNERRGRRSINTELR